MAAEDAVGNIFLCLWLAVAPTAAARCLLCYMMVRLAADDVISLLVRWDGCG